MISRLKKSTSRIFFQRTAPVRFRCSEVRIFVSFPTVFRELKGIENSTDRHFMPNWITNLCLCSDSFTCGQRSVLILSVNYLHPNVICVKFGPKVRVRVNLSRYRNTVHIRAHDIQCSVGTIRDEVSNESKTLAPDLSRFRENARETKTQLSARYFSFWINVVQHHT